MEIAGDLTAATSKVTGIRAKACSSSLGRVVCKAPQLVHGTRSQPAALRPASRFSECPQRRRTRAYANIVYLAGQRRMQLSAAMPRSRNSTAEQPGIRGGELSNIQ
jgi:hypothetical protein